jgi:hypothetical protein
MSEATSQISDDRRETLPDQGGADRPKARSVKPLALLWPYVRKHLTLVFVALFFLVGMLQDRAHTRGISDFGGLLGRVPWLGWAFILSAFASLGLPGLAHFPAEFQIFLATLNGMSWGVAAILAIVVTAAGFCLSSGSGSPTIHCC